MRTHCINGHDLRKVGLNSHGRCKECRRLAMQAYRSRHKCPSQRISPVPLANLIIRQSYGYDDGLRGVARQIACRLAEDFETTETNLGRIIHNPDKFILRSTGDKYAIAMGYHPTQLWGEEIWEAI